jgi:MIP family channel proteins
MPQMWVRNAVAEGIGAFVLTFVALMTFTTGDITPYAVAQGLTILVLVAALGHVSGGHFNPAVTLAFLLGRRIDVVGASIYWAAQLIGGIIAALVVLLTLSRDTVAAGVPVPATEGELNVLGAIVLEAIAVFVVVLVVLGTIVDHRAPLSVYPFAIGLAYAAGIFAIGGFTGGALNPARAFGPAVVGGEWEGIASWLIGPLLGAALAWVLFEYVIVRPGEEEEPLAEDDSISGAAISADPATSGSGIGPTAGVAMTSDSAQAAKAAAGSEEPGTAVTGVVESDDEVDEPEESGDVPVAVGLDDEAVEPDEELVEPDEELVEPDEELVGPDEELVEPDDEVDEPEDASVEPEVTKRRPDQLPPPPPPSSTGLPSSHKGLLDQ